MAPSRNRAQRTQEEEEENQERERWDRLFVEADTRQRMFPRFAVSVNRDDSDDEDFAPAPIYDRALNVQGAERVLRMCNFAPIEFERLWDVVEDHVLSHWNMGRGKKSTNSPKDILFMSLAALKHCGSWDTVSSMFEMEPSPFQKMVKKFITMMEPFLYETFVEAEEKSWTMKKLAVSGRTFTNFPCARYETDVTFQQADRPSGGYNEVKKYFSGKHHLYGYKVEVSVLPTGTAINCTGYEPGGESDLNMFKGNSEFHRSAMQKLSDEAMFHDEGPAADRFEHDLAVLVDKGYQGLQAEYRTIQPKKARGAPTLTLDERRKNDSILHDRVIVENYFGRLKTLWGVCSRKWFWDRKSYNTLFRVCVVMTNYAVRCPPLRR